MEDFSRGLGKRKADPHDRLLGKAENRGFADQEQAEGIVGAGNRKDGDCLKNREFPEREEGAQRRKVFTASEDRASAFGTKGEKGVPWNAESARARRVESG